ncbi:MAG TPA: hypothetical protein VF667_04660, partial [Pseudonocardia sp.]
MTVDGRAGVGRDADDEANARRLAEALRAQAALGARPGAAPARTPTPPPAGPRSTPGPGTGGLRPGGPSGSQPGHAMAARGRPL